jgi:chromosome segregation ATPase
MKPRSQAITADGFDTNVAEKMPRIRKLEEPLHSPLEEESLPPKEDRYEPIPEMRPPERQIERKMIFESPEKRVETEQSLDVLNLIEDLHAQLLASAQTKRALEMDLVSYKKTIHQLSQDNQELHRQLEALRKEHQRLKEFQSESYYLQEENVDALEKIKEFQQELRDTRETLNKAIQEKEEALNRMLNWNPRWSRMRWLNSKGS